MALHATQGPTLGLPQMIQSRAQFGFRGVSVAMFAMLFTYMAFNVADQVLLAQGLHGAFGWNANLVAIVVTVGAALLAIYGYDWVHRVFRGILLILLPLVAIITIGVIAGKAGGVVNHHVYRVSWTGFIAQVSAPAAYNITYPGYVSDYSRYLPRDTPPGQIIGYPFARCPTAAVGVVDTVLTLMLYLLVPWTVTNLIDFFFVRHGHYAVMDIFRPNGIYGMWSYRGLIAYAAGFAAEIPFMVLLNLVTLKSYYTGPLAKDLNSVDISWIVGAVVTGVVYLLLTRNLDVAAEQAAIERSDAELRSIASAAST